jgi:hypothetical protein
LQKKKVIKHLIYADVVNRVDCKRLQNSKWLLCFVLFVLFFGCLVSILQLFYGLLQHKTFIRVRQRLKKDFGFFGPRRQAGAGREKNSWDSLPR